MEMATTPIGTSTTFVSITISTPATKHRSAEPGNETRPQPLKPVSRIGRVATTDWSRRKPRVSLRDRWSRRLSPTIVNEFRAGHAQKLELQLGVVLEAGRRGR